MICWHLDLQKVGRKGFDCPVTFDEVVFCLVRFMDVAKIRVRFIPKIMD